MTTTPNLELPYIQPAQAQKHVTHNEALRALDAIVQLGVLTRALATPPATPAEGARYLVPAGATGAWEGVADRIAAYQDGAWSFYTPRQGWLAWVADEALAVVWSGSSWVTVSGLGGGPRAVLTTSLHGAFTAIAMLEEELTVTGAMIDSTVAIPDRAIVLAVTTRTTVAITGAASYGCGIAGEAGKYGDLLGISAGSTNSGVTGPTAYYAPTPIRLTANGSPFTGGKVRIAIHYIACGAPAS